MLAGTHNSEDRIAIVRGGQLALEDMLKIKRAKMINREFTLLAQVETIVLELDKTGRYDAREAFKVGRRLHWPSNGPDIGLTRPEEDLIFTNYLRLPLPNVPDPHYVLKDPYGVGPKGLLPPQKVPKEAPKIRQRLADRASGVWGEFVICQPVAEIICRPYGLGPRWASIKVLTGWDGRQMALLVNPFTGEAYFSGGRIQFSVKG